MLSQGATFLVPIPGVPKHLCVILIGPFVPPGCGIEYVIYVNITSVKGAGVGDQTCVLNDGDHDFIDHSSLVNYPTAQFLPLSRCLIDFESGRYVQKEQMRPEVVKKILDGLLLSKHTPRKIKRILTEIEEKASGQ